MQSTETDSSIFDYHLPKKYIAQTPALPRESAKLMHLRKSSGSISHHTISDLPSFFQRGDVVVVNNTKVFKARLFGTVSPGNHTIELLLIKPLGNDQWHIIAKPGKRLIVGATVTIAPEFVAHVQRICSDGSRIVSFREHDEDVIRLTHIYGHVPVPPYIAREPILADYQTSYAKITGSVAAPTAGFHMTETIQTLLIQKGVRIEEITLHVGLGTFAPIKMTTLEQHHMHSEWVQISPRTAHCVVQAKNDHRRIIAIGTTTVRALEGVAHLHHGTVVPFIGDVNLFITPGFTFQVIDGLLTNFHLPKSTLLVLVSAFAGFGNVMSAYHSAIQNNYRFYSFGDAMLIT